MGRLKNIKPRLAVNGANRVAVAESPKSADKRMRGRAWMARRFEVFARDGFSCKACGRVLLPRHAECDHIVRISDGGTDDATNLQTLCRDCHAKKTVDENRRCGGWGRGV